MKTPIHTGAFKKDVKLAQKRKKNIEKLQIIVELLLRGETLPLRCKPHKLSGDYASYWECHIEPDWLLIYKLTEDALLLARTGTHSDLFD